MSFSLSFLAVERGRTGVLDWASIGTTMPKEAAISSVFMTGALRFMGSDPTDNRRRHKCPRVKNT